MDASRVQRIREDMERAEARRLQPHYIESFFHEAFQRLGGTAKQREPRRYEVTHVPAPVRNRDRLIGIGEPVLPRYERIAFEKSCVAPQGQPLAAFVCPGHPLLDAVIDLTLERHRDLLKRGAVLVDERDPGTRRACCSTSNTRSRTRASRARASAGSSPSGCSTSRWTPTGRPVMSTTRLTSTTGRWPRASPASSDPRAARVRVDRPRARAKAQGYAIAHVVPEHLTEVRDGKLELIAKTEAAVKDRLTKEITYWDHRAEQLKLQEQAGKPNAKLNSGEARKRADELQGRLAEAAGGAEARSADLAAAAGGARRPARGPAGLLAAMAGRVAADADLHPSIPRPALPCPRRRHGDRARPRLRADGPRVREARLRHREPRPRDRQAALHRGEGSGHRARIRSP